MLDLNTFANLYPNLAYFAGTYQRRSSLGRIFLVRKNRWGNSPARMWDRREKIKNNIRGMVNSSRISQTADKNLLSLNLKNIPDRNKRRAYAAVVKKAGRGIGRVCRCSGVEWLNNRVSSYTNSCRFFNHARAFR